MIRRGLTGGRLTAVAAGTAISVGAMVVRARHWLPGAGIETCESWHDDNCAGINAWPSLGNAMGAPAAALVERHAQPTGNSPELPRSVVDTRLPALSGRVLRAARSGDLQRALDGARPGDQIVLSPGVTYAGNFRLRRYVGNGWVVIRPDLPESKLPAPGNRATPGSTSLPRIVTPNANPALATDPGAAGYRIIGVEVGAAPSVTTAYSLVALGEGDKSQNSLDRVPRRIILDRVIVRGHDSLDVRRGVALNGAELAVMDSWIAGIHSKSDAAAVWGWNGPGPFRIEGNRLEGSGENIMFGGSDPSIQGLNPSDIEIRRNHIIKPLAWRGRWLAKNLIEFKSAVRVLIEGNVFENSWLDGQVGWAAVWWATDQDGTAPWATTSDITFRLNKIRNVAGGFQLTDHGDRAVNPAMKRIAIVDNVFIGLGSPELGTNGRLVQLSGRLSQIWIERNTGLAPVSSIYFVGGPTRISGLTIRDNILGGGDYNVYSAVGQGADAIRQFSGIGSTFDGNLIVRPAGVRFPQGNATVSSVEDVGFVNPAVGDYRLGPGSPYRRSISIRGRSGANVDDVEAATKGVAIGP